MAGRDAGRQAELPGMAPAPRRSERIFFAALPDAAAARRIDRLARRLHDEHGLRGAPIGLARYHVTLLFLGDFTPVDAQAVTAAATARAAAVVAAPFDVVFERVASFERRSGKAPVVLLGSDRVDGLIDLHERLIATIAPTVPGGMPAFTPHLTLLRDTARLVEQEVEPIDWRVRDFALVHSAIGAGVHTVLRRWPLSC